MPIDRSIKNHLGLTGRWLYISLMICNSFAMLLFGYDQGVFGGILTIASFEQRFGLVGEETLKGVIVGSYDLGCLLGALLTYPIGERIGRKRSILLGTTVMMIGAFLQFLAGNFGVMVAGRVIAGIGNGMNTATAPVWAAETSKTAQRGSSGMILMVVNIAGLAISCWMTYGCSFLTTEFSWRFPLAFQLFFGLIIVLFAIWLPESPRWLIAKNRDAEARSIMVALEGHGATAASGIVVADFEEIKKSIALEQNPTKSRNTKPTFRLILGVGAQAMQQLTGINIICYYLPYVLVESVGQEPSTARLVAAANALSYLGATFIGLYFIEKWGRRWLMMFGALGQCICWAIITIFLSAANDAAYIVTAASSSVEKLHSPKEKAFGSASVAFFFLFNIFFGAGWQGVSWLYPTEINSTSERIRGMSFGVATNWLINFGVVFVTPLGIAALKAQFYVIWTVCNAIMIPVIYFFYPETAGRSLEDIDEMFAANPTIWVGFNKEMMSRKRKAGGGGEGDLEWAVELDDIPQAERLESVPSRDGEKGWTPVVGVATGSEVSMGQLPRSRPSSRPGSPVRAVGSLQPLSTMPTFESSGTGAATMFESMPSVGSRAPLL